MVQVDIIQFVEELYRAKRGGNSLALLELRLPPSPALGEQITVSSTSRLRTHTDYTAGFPGFPVYRRQMSDCGIYQPPKCLSLSPLSLLYIYTQRDNIVTHSYIQLHSYIYSYIVIYRDTQSYISLYIQSNVVIYMYIQLHSYICRYIYTYIQLYIAIYSYIVLYI